MSLGNRHWPACILQCNVTDRRCARRVLYCRLTTENGIVVPYPRLARSLLWNRSKLLVFPENSSKLASGRQTYVRAMTRLSKHARMPQNNQPSGSGSDCEAENNTSWLLGVDSVGTPAYSTRREKRRPEVMGLMILVSHQLISPCISSADP